MKKVIKRLLLLFALVISLFLLYILVEINTFRDGTIHLNRTEVINEVHKKLYDLSLYDHETIRIFLDTMKTSDDRELFDFAINIDGKEIGVKYKIGEIYHEDYDKSPWAEYAEYGLCYMFIDEPMTYIHDVTNQTGKMSNINYLEHFEDSIYVYIIYYADLT